MDVRKFVDKVSELERKRKSYVETLERLRKHEVALKEGSEDGYGIKVDTAYGATACFFKGNFSSKHLQELHDILEDAVIQNLADVEDELARLASMCYKEA